MADPTSTSPADVIGRLIIDLALGSSPLEDAAEQARADWPVKVSLTPDRPDNVIVVTDTAGRDLGRPHPVGRRVHLYGVQIKVRSATHARGWGKAQSLYAGLSLSADVYDREVVVDGVRYVVHSVQFTGPPLVLGAEQGSSRRVFTLNALAGVRQL